LKQALTIEILNIIIIQHQGFFELIRKRHGLMSVVVEPYKLVRHKLSEFNYACS